MLPNKAKKSTHQSDLDASLDNMSDPWQDSPTEPMTMPVPQTWNLAQENSSLISSLGIPGTPSLAGHQSTSAEILLEDELKLKTSPGNLLKQQLEKALALLFWNK